MTVSTQKSRSLKSLRILMQMRSNAFSHRGGDTVVLEKFAEGLKQLGHHVDIDVENQFNPKDYDLVHLYNFATPEITEAQAKRAVESGTPYVVTTMYEDWPFFFSPMVENFLVLESYIELDQPKEHWKRLVDSMERLPETAMQDNSYTAFHAEALIATGANEVNALKRDYPHSKFITDYRCGCEVANPNPDPDLFRKYIGINDFVLCVGRLEWRKNQLGLLKAMEESDMPLVLMTGSVTYQPDYEVLARKFKRRGKTLYLPRVEADLLASAFAAARAHVLPSFFELPGLVSIEAARYGTNVVVTDYGTIRDYLGDDAYYCNPSSPESILKAVEAACNAPRSKRLQERTKDFTWSNSVKRIMQIYTDVLKRHGYTGEINVMDSSDYGDIPRLDAAIQTIAGASVEVTKAKETVSLIPAHVGATKLVVDARAEALCEEGDNLARASRNNEATERYREASKIAPQYARAYRGMGVIALNEQKFADAEGYFRRALMSDRDDVKSELGIAMILGQTNRKKDSIETYGNVLKRYPANLIAVRQYLQLAYELKEYSGLEGVLRGYLATDSTNADMQFCLAGCLYKQGRLEESRKEAEATLKANPYHASSKELLAEIAKILSGTPQQSVQSVSPAQQAVSPALSTQDVKAASSEIRELEELVRQKKFAEVDARAQILRNAGKLTASQMILVEIIQAEAWICLGKGKDAKSVLESYRDDVDHAARATASLGVYWGSENNWDKASQLFRVSTALNPAHDVPLAGLGIASLLKGDREGAWEYFSRAHAANPENVRALTGMIEVAYPLKRLDALEQALLRYLEYVPANLSILYAHAGCAYALGKIDLATSQLEKIRIFDPNHVLANELLAKIHEESGTWGQARA